MTLSLNFGNLVRTRIFILLTTEDENLTRPRMKTEPTAGEDKINVGAPLASWITYRVAFRDSLPWSENTIRHVPISGYTSVRTAAAVVSAPVD